MPFKDSDEGTTRWYVTCTRCGKDEVNSMAKYSDTEIVCRKCVEAAQKK